MSTLTTLLEKSDITTEDVLNEPDLLQECKTNNQKLIAYLQQKEVLQRLLDYVIGAVEVEGVAGDDTEEKVGFKYVLIRDFRTRLTIVTGILIWPRKCLAARFPRCPWPCSRTHKAC